MFKRLAIIALLSGIPFLCQITHPTSAQAKDDQKATIGGFRGEALAQVADVEKKIEDLAQAIPDDKYSWRPMEGVRSVSEVYMHIAGANYLFPTFIGVKKPEGLERDMEKNVTTKAKVLEALKASFDHLRTAITQTPDASLSKSTKMFGDETTYMGVIFTATSHLHEHLGQSIAYARMNHVVPPWTAASEAEKKGK
jgi:uncharacterized damage-inducible protein DinB